MEYTGPAALNEGIKAIGEAFTSRPAISLQDLMQRKQLEQAMKPITLDELKAKTPPDLYEPMMKLAGSNGLIENVNGIQFIRQHNVKDFHKTLSENKVWQQMVLDESIKNSNALIEQRLPELEQRKAKHEARLRYWDDQRKKAMATTDAKGNQMAPNMKAIDSIDREMAEYQQGDEYKQMMSLEKQLMGIKELQKRRLQSFGINEDGFKKDTETYGSDEALKIAIYGTNYRRQLDRQLKEEKLQDEFTLAAAKEGLKPEGNQTIEQLTARALKGDKEAAAILKKMQVDKIAVARASREPKDPKKTYQDTQDRFNAKIDVVEKRIGRKLSADEIKRMAINDPYGTLAPEEETQTLPPVPTKQPQQINKPKYTITASGKDGQIGWDGKNWRNVKTGKIVK